MKRILALMAAVPLSLVLVEGDGRAQQPLPAPGCTIVWVAAPTPLGKSLSRRRPLDFSASNVLDLHFWVVLPSANAQPGRSLELKLFTPNGHLYQTLTAPLGGSAIGAVARRVQPFQTVTLRLPVAGTTIVHNSLYGEWTAAAYLDGDASPCAKARSFQIRP